MKQRTLAERFTLEIGTMSRVRVLEALYAEGTGPNDSAQRLLDDEDGHRCTDVQRPRTVGVSHSGVARATTRRRLPKDFTFASSTEPLGPAAIAAATSTSGNRATASSSTRRDSPSGQERRRVGPMFNSIESRPLVARIRRVVFGRKGAPAGGPLGDTASSAARNVNQIVTYGHGDSTSFAEPAEGPTDPQT